MLHGTTLWNTQGASGLRPRESSVEGAALDGVIRRGLLSEDAVLRVELDLVFLPFSLDVQILLTQEGKFPLDILILSWLGFIQ